MIGGGYIGLEMGTVYAELGSQVTVVELLDGLLPGADRDLVKPLEKRLRERFAGIHLGTKVTALKAMGDKIEVTMEDPVPNDEARMTNDEKQSHSSFAIRHSSFDRVLVSIGRRPVTSGIGLENTKVKINDKGFVVVNEQQQTADPHILAIGDVAGEPMLAHKASHEGKVAAEVLAGRAGRVRAAGDSRRGLHRSGNRLGRPHDQRSRTRRPRRRHRPVPVASQRSRHRQRPHRRTDQAG